MASLPVKASPLSRTWHSFPATVEELRLAVQTVVPPGFRAKVTIVIDNGVVTADNITVELRLPQRPKETRF